MKQTVPLLITAVAGLVLIVSTFIPVAQQAGEMAAVWFDLLAAIAFVLGGGNLLRLHLKKTSDRKPGWGYSAITIVAFLSTLFLGLFKVGAPPEQSVEYFGQTFVPYPLESMPEFRIPGELIKRADGAPWPASVRRQLREEDGQIVFQSWMTPNQFSDLIDYRESLRWWATVEELAETAAVPEPLQGRASYLADHGALAFSGFMTSAQRDALLAALGNTPEAVRAVDSLYELSRQPTTITVSRVPESFAIPEAYQEVVTLAGGQITIHGPMSTTLRDEMAQYWPHPDRVRPLPVAERQALRAEIESLGAPLSSEQAAAFDAFFEADWKPELLIQAVNSAGILPPETKSYRQLLAEVESGQQDPPRELPAPEPVLLNAAQEQAIIRFAEDPAVSTAQLIADIDAAGDWTVRQRLALLVFLDQQPTRAEQSRDLFFRLRRLGPLSPEQREFLLQGYREQFHWQQSVGRLFVDAHQTKYPWSGDYTAQGTPFWWLYQYIFQPLLTTTFAMLAFYVASAAFRAFRAKNLEAILLLGTAFIILLGRTFAGYALTSWFPDWMSGLRIDQLTVYIMSTFVTAGNRAIMIGIALGIVSTSLKVLLGIDRTYLGTGKD